MMSRQGWNDCSGGERDSVESVALRRAMASHERLRVSSHSTQTLSHCAHKFDGEIAIWNHNDGARDRRRRSQIGAVGERRKLPGDVPCAPRKSRWNVAELSKPQAKATSATELSSAFRNRRLARSNRRSVT
jgi:hypothetical protein